MEGKKAPEGLPNEAGRIAYSAYVQNPPSPSLRKRRVFLTFVAEDDGDRLAKHGLAYLRQARILRLCREAQEQGALLAYDDLIQLLSTSLSTIKRDLRELKQRGLVIPIYRKKQRAIKGNS